MKRKFFKILIVGNSSVGKTSLLKRYVNDVFSDNYKATIGADFLTKEFTYDSIKLMLQIWDTAGQERYRSLSMAYYRGADACIFVYDLTLMSSFKELDLWYNTFSSQVPEDRVKGFPYVVFGNKADKIEREVKREMAEKWCQDHGMPYFETSAKTGEGVNEGFEFLAKTAYEKMIKK